MCVLLSREGPGRLDGNTRAGTARYMVTFRRNGERCKHAWREMRGELAEKRVLSYWKNQGFACDVDSIEEIEGSYKDFAR